VSKAGARAVLALADLYLDAFPSGDPAELLDPLSAGLPLLPLAAAKRAAGASVKFIASTAAGPCRRVAGEYESMALSLAASSAERASLRNEAPACRTRLTERDTLISWLSFPSRVATSDSKSGRMLD